MELIDITLFNDGKKYFIKPCCEDCHANVSIMQVESFSGLVHVAHCSRCGNYLKVINYQPNGIPHCAICYFQDGDMVCCVFGDFVNLQESPAGFGKTNEEAFEDLKRNWDEIKQLIKVE